MSSGTAQSGPRVEISTLRSGEVSVAEDARPRFARIGVAAGFLLARVAGSAIRVRGGRTNSC